MNNDQYRFLQTVLGSAAIGGFALLTVAVAVLAFDVLSIASLVSASDNKGLVSAVFIGGALTKGLAFGAAFGLAFATLGRGASYEVSARSPEAMVS